jgi:glycerol-3-phosphate dehydrogenase
MRCAARCGQIVAQELGLSPQDGLRQACSFLAKQSQTRAVALGPEQAQQEALAIASVRAELGFGAKDAEGDPKPQMYKQGMNAMAEAEGDAK